MKFDLLDHKGERLIFLISLPRAGSTLLQRILGTHPLVHTMSEPWIMLHPLYALRQKMISEFGSVLAHKALKNFCAQVPEKEELYITAVRRLANTLYGRQLELSGKEFFLDKTPRYFNVVPELLRVYPQAKYVILLRNPLAVLSSVLSSWFSNDVQSLRKSMNNHDVMNGPRLLIAAMNSLQAGIVQYEKLVVDPDGTIRDLCTYLKIPYLPEMLDYGNREKRRWLMGDSMNVYRNDKPNAEYCDKWVKHLKSRPQLHQYARQYLATLGPTVFSQMGYDYDESEKRLNS